jgi:hypothetical protein
VLLVVPITFVLADALDIDPIPLVVMEIIASNIGGTATLIGDPPNIIIAGATGLSFGAFIVNLTPPVLVAFVLVVGRAVLRLPRPPAGHAEARARDARARRHRAIEDRAEAKRTVPILLGTILLFFVHKPLHLEPATCALAGASVMLLVTRHTVQDALSNIEWPTLFFFIGLFVIVGALEETGAIGEVADAIGSATGGDRTAELMGSCGRVCDRVGHRVRLPHFHPTLTTYARLTSPPTSSHRACACEPPTSAGGQRGRRRPVLVGARVARARAFGWHATTCRRGHGAACGCRARRASDLAS